MSSLESERPEHPESWLVGAISGCARGVIAGERRALRAVLIARFGPLSPETLARVAACDRLAQLDAWLRRAAVVGTLDAVWRAPDEATEDAA